MEAKPVASAILKFKVNGVQVKDICDNFTGFQIAGPNVTTLLQKVMRDTAKTIQF